MFISDAEVRHGLLRNPDGILCVHGASTDVVSDDDTDEAVGVTIKAFGHDHMGNRVAVLLIMSCDQAADTCSDLMGVLLDMPTEHNGGTRDGDEPI